MVSMEARGMTRDSPLRAAGEPGWSDHARRALDLTVAALALALLSPLLLAITLAIRLDSAGPALFRQRRIGHRGREFTVLKFRSMRADADPRGHREYVTALIEGRADGVPAGGKSIYKLAVDDRVTAVGRWIRRWSIDELPQLLNVLAGQMSLVGPRPAIPYEVEKYPDWYLERFTVKPGLTGFWQVSGRNEHTYEEMVRLDIEYARRRSLGLDLAILLKTPWVVLSRRGAA
jgi:lipopolysaccharide/colanic/teichoic acid biosynthesis glycosyltransferase